jgi:hypothetical protein
MEEFHLKVTLFQWGADFSSGHHTRVVAVPFAAPEDIPEIQNTHKLAVFCNRDIRQVALNRSAQDNGASQDSIGPAEKGPGVRPVQALPVVLVVESPLLMPACPVLVSWQVFRRRAGSPWRLPGCHPWRGQSRVPSVAAVWHLPPVRADRCSQHDTAPAVEVLIQMPSHLCR